LKEFHDITDKRPRKEARNTKKRFHEQCITFTPWLSQKCPSISKNKYHLVISLSSFLSLFFLSHESICEVPPAS
jgi:hypothetical protein